MKKVIYFLFATVVGFTACYKPADPGFATLHLNNVADSDYISTIGKYIRVHPAIANYDDINFAQYRVSKQSSKWYVRLPFNNKSIATDFILFQTDSAGNVADGRIIHLTQEVLHTKNEFNGSIDITSLDHATALHSNITNGYIEVFHSTLFSSDSSRNGGLVQKAESFPMPKVDDLPEVVVVAYLPAASTASGISVGDYMLLQSMFNGSGSGGGGGSGTGGTGGSGGNGSGNGGGGGSASTGGYGVYTPLDYGDPSTPQPISGGVAPHQDPNYDLTYDESFFRPAIDLNAWLKCFSDIPDAGAEMSITLYGDLPVFSDPSVGINIWNGNTGHCFLSLSKTNGSQSVTQVIGFTAQSAGKAILNCDAFVPSKIVDNAGHKYNCSITMNLSATGMQEVMRTIVNQADMPYSVVNYDCLDFGLDVFNSVRQVPLKVNKQFVTNDPFSNIANGPKLYSVLSDMVDNGSPETGNILVGSSLYVRKSHGPCN